MGKLGRQFRKRKKPKRKFGGNFGHMLAAGGLGFLAGSAITEGAGALFGAIGDGIFGGLF
eukprot:NODE_3323_length_682_cov_50.067930_g2361_i0.p4 GENE.NODE_3323_length_682_cov_50.067930_g2361_i0~~NODE_3323_length_682_cov_50.067930_g2361_i0.p4  ORF type:complete len:68 (+),score=39.02 NODE_3323_length_682_cov_50.067930_g2361_i0:26-205(+)